MRGLLIFLMATGCCALMGAAASGRLRRRAETLSALCGAVKRMMLGVAYTDAALADLLCCAGEEDGLPALIRMAEGVRLGEDPLGAWDEAWKAEAPVKLEEGDLRPLRDFFLTLGRSSREMQLNSGRVTIALLEERAAEARADYGKRGRMIRTMGLLLGAGLGILLW